MAEHLNVHPRAVMRRLHFFRCGGQAIFEVFEYEAPGQSPRAAAQQRRRGAPRRPVRRDLDAAVAYLREHDVQVLGEPTASRGPAQGQRWVYFLSPWGMQFELVSYPQGKAFDHDPDRFAGGPA